MQNVIKMNDQITVAEFEPSTERFKDIAEEGFKSVINLQTQGEEQKTGEEEEKQAAKEAGLTYSQIGVSGKNLTDEIVDQFRAEVEKLPSPVLVHCASGKRSGALAMMHIACQEGQSGEEALEKAESMGFECDMPELKEFVKGYVDRHNG